MKPELLPIVHRLGANVRQARDAAGLTQSELARRCDIDHTFPSSIESGRKLPSLVTLLKLASGLEVRRGDLLEGMPVCRPGVTEARTFLRP